MSYKQGQLMAEERMDTLQCGKGWEGIQGKCKRVKKKKEPANDSFDKSLKALVPVAGTLASGIILSQIGKQMERQIQRKIGKQMNEAVDEAVDKVQNKVVSVYKKVSSNFDKKRSPKS